VTSGSNKTQISVQRSRNDRISCLCIAIRVHCKDLTTRNMDQATASGLCRRYTASLVQTVCHWIVTQTQVYFQA